VEDAKDTSFGIDILEHNFTQLPAEGRFLLINFLQNLVSMQNTMSGAVSAENARSSSNDSKGGCSESFMG
jgi:hypothetical protein